MVKERMDLLELMRKRGVDGDVDFLREALRVLVEEIMEADVSSRTGAGYGERNPERVTQRNGYRSRAWDTRRRDNGVADTQAEGGELLPEPIGATASQRASSAGGDPAGVMWRVYRRGEWMIWSRLLGARVSQRAKCRVSARSWTGWWRASWVGR